MLLLVLLLLIVHIQIEALFHCWCSIACERYSTPYIIVTKVLSCMCVHMLVQQSNGERLSQLGRVGIIRCSSDRSYHSPHNWRADLVVFVPLEDHNTADSNTDANRTAATKQHCQASTHNDSLCCCREGPGEEGWKWNVAVGAVFFITVVSAVIKSITLSLQWNAVGIATYKDTGMSAVNYRKEQGN